MTDTRVANIAIIIESDTVVTEVQKLLSEYGQYIIGRMGLPYREKNIKIISVVLDAPTDIINALTGKIGRIENVNAKTVYSKN